MVVEGEPSAAGMFGAELRSSHAAFLRALSGLVVVLFERVLSQAL